MSAGEREEDAARREAEEALGKDRRRTPPVSDRPVEEPVAVPRPDLEEPTAGE